MPGIIRYKPGLIRMSVRVDSADFFVFPPSGVAPDPYLTRTRQFD